MGSQLNSQLKSRQKKGKEEAVNLVKNTLTEFKVEAEVSEIMEKTGDIYSGYDLATCRDERAHHQPVDRAVDIKLSEVRGRTSDAEYLSGQ